MFSISRMKPLHAVIGTVAVFLLWSVISMGWYVCGVNGMCAEAHEDVVHYTAEEAVEHSLADTQAPLVAGYDRAGAAGEIFVMLMIAFTLGALMGRVLGVTGSSDSAPFEASKIAPIHERVGAPIHISAITKTVARPSVPMNIPAPVSAPKPTPIIHLPPTTSRAPIMQIKPPAKLASETPATKNQDRPKVRFNTSWSNPVRNKPPGASSAS